MKEYEVELRITKFIKIKAENDFDCSNKADKIAEKLKMKVVNFELLDGQMEPDKYSKPQISAHFDEALKIIVTSNQPFK